jgi:4-amino-4-deoxy-L-arabinose transferase-like glycosyltransferase
MPNRDPESQASSVMVKLQAGQYDWLLLGIIVAVALFLRLYQLASSPPGLSGDELFNAIDAQLIGSGNWPIFFEGNYGREAFFFYVMAASLKLFGSTVWAVRLPAVLLGTGNVILAFLLGRNMFNRRVGLLAAALIAVSLWPVMGSRWGLRAVSLTFLTALTVYFFYKAVYFDKLSNHSFGRLSNHHFFYWLLGGISLGLTFYTYIPSRIFPLVFIIWFGWLVWRQRDLAHQYWRQFLLALFVALLLFAPFGWYMMQYPDKVNQRINTMSSALKDVQEGEITAVVEPILGVLGMFSFVGDNKWRYHLSEQPVFDPITSIFFYIGIGLCIWFAFARKRDADKWAPAPTYALVLLWLGAMLAANAVASANPSFLRTAGALVPVYLITGIGVDAAYQWLVQKWPRLTWSPLIPALIVMGLVITAVGTWHNYFDVWRNNPEVREIYSAQTASMAEFLEAHPPPPGTRVYAADRYAYSAAPRLMSFYNDLPITWFMSSRTFPWDEMAVENWYLVPADEPLRLLDHLPAEITAAAEMISYEDGQDSFVWYRVPETAVSQSPTHSLNQPYQNGPTLLGYELPETLYRGEEVPLLLYWRIPFTMLPQENKQTHTQIFLEDGQSHIWANESSLLGYPQAGWQAGDQFVQQLMLDIPDGLPPEPMRLRLELADNNSANSYPKIGGPNNYSDPFVVLGRPLSDFVPASDMPVWDDTLVLKDKVLSTMTEPGLPIDLALDWVALQAPTEDYQVSLVLADPATGAILVEQTDVILPDVYPTSHWQEGEQLRTMHRLKIPIDFPAEITTLDLLVSLNPAAGAAETILTQGQDKLAEITLVRREHHYEIPSISEPIEAQFGPDIRLLGYDLDTEAEDTIGLTLYWQAVNTPPIGYTVFTHLLNGNGDIVAQVDSAPVSDAWLSSAWLPGEIIVDTRTIPLPDGLPPGDYHIALGLYDDNGRLPVTLNNQPQANDQFIIPSIPLSGS